MLYSIELRSRSPFGLFFSSVDSFLDAGLLAGQIAEVEDTCTTYFTVLVHLDAVDEGGLEREDSFDTDTTGNLADREGLGERIHTLHLNDDTSEFLEAFLVSLFDSVGNGDGITGLEFRVGSGFLILESLLCNFNQIHNSKILYATLRFGSLQEVAFVLGLQRYELLTNLQIFFAKK